MSAFEIFSGLTRIALLAMQFLVNGALLENEPGVFVAGEMLDWEAPTGGYLLTGCLATGAWAGRAAARKLMAA